MSDTYETIREWMLANGTDSDFDRRLAARLVDIYQSDRPFLAKLAITNPNIRLWTEAHPA